MPCSVDRGYYFHTPAGTAVRFEPGERKRVTLVALSGERIVYGGEWVDGWGVE